jgi:hypothetical protein
VTRGGIAILYLGAGVLGLVGIALRLLPPQVPVPSLAPPAAPVDPAPADAAAQAAALLTYAAITQADVFAPDRGPTARARRAAPAPATGATLRLFGVASGAAGAVALIDADPAIPGAEIYRAGDRVAGYTITAIADTLVVLDGPAGRRVLTLRQPPLQRRSP